MPMEAATTPLQNVSLVSLDCFKSFPFMPHIIPYPPVICVCAVSIWQTALKWVGCSLDMAIFLRLQGVFCQRCGERAAFDGEPILLMPVMQIVRERPFNNSILKKTFYSNLQSSGQRSLTNCPSNSSTPKIRILQSQNHPIHNRCWGKVLDPLLGPASWARFLGPLLGPNTTKALGMDGWLGDWGACFRFCIVIQWAASERSN